MTTTATNSTDRRSRIMKSIEPDMPIVRVQFTWSLPGGLWVEYGSGHREWLSMDVIVEVAGPVEAHRMHTTAHHGGWTGMWYDLEPPAYPESSDHEPSAEAVAALDEAVADFRKRADDALWRMGA